MQVPTWFRVTPGPKFTKFRKEVSIGQTPNRAKFHRARSNDVREKRYNFYTLQYFGVPRALPVPKFTNLGDGVQQGPLYQAAKFRPVLKTPVGDICCQSSSISLMA